MLAYLTSKRYPATTADHLYVQSLAEAFAKLLGDAFELVISGPAASEIAEIPTRSVEAPRRFRALYYFVWFPAYALALDDRAVIFSNDINLLTIAIAWRTLLRKRYRVVSDWHLLTGTWKDAFVARRSDLLIATSRRLKEALVAAVRIDSARVHAVYGGVDVESYEAPLSGRTELGLPRGFLIGYVGGFRTLGKEKGIGVMLEALTHLPPEARMAFVGGSSGEIEEYKRRAASLGLEDRSIWVPKQPYEKVAAYERNMDVLVIPYPDEPHFRDFGFPMKAYEYLAAGKPIVYSDLAIMKEVLAGKGIAFTPNDPISLSEAIGEARNAPLRRGSAEAFSWDAKARAILAAIQSIP